jgi:hypothetical protein
MRESGGDERAEVQHLRAKGSKKAHLPPPNSRMGCQPAQEALQCLPALLEEASRHAASLGGVAARAGGHEVPGVARLRLEAPREEGSGSRVRGCPPHLPASSSASSSLPSSLSLLLPPPSHRQHIREHHNLLETPSHSALHCTGVAGSCSVGAGNREGDEGSVHACVRAWGVMGE